MPPTCIKLLIAPLLEPADDVCVISLKHQSEFRHAVRASDTFVYDATALHAWLRSQRGRRPYHVIPGCNIHSVEYTSWAEYIGRRSCRIVRRLASNAWTTVSRGTRRPAVPPKASTVCEQTETHVQSTPRVCIPSAHSAFDRCISKRKRVAIPSENSAFAKVAAAVAPRETSKANRLPWVPARLSQTLVVWHNLCGCVT